MRDITKMSDEELADALQSAWHKSPPSGAAWPTLARYVRTLTLPTPTPMARTILPPLQIEEDGCILAVCNDGTVLSFARGMWRELPPIPQPTPAPTRFGLPPASTRLTPEQQAAQDRAEAEMHVEFEDHSARYTTDPVREAAPELLAAAKVALNATVTGKWYASATDALVAAIAKAEGRA